jgi:xanthine dehydrogenase molybdenum-binding subunit
MTTTERPPYKVIGTRPIRHDGVDKVTGRAVYGNDVNIPGHITGRILRSPHAHARILSIDTSRATALPGVRAVITGRDMPYVSPKLHEQGENSLINLGMLSRNVLAQDKALFAGHAVAAVAADDPYIAERALELIDVRYEVLKPVMDGLDAMAPGAPILMEDLKTNTASLFRGGGFRADDEPRYDTNLASSFEMEIGDLANGFELADIVLEHDYHAGEAHQGYIEPQSATALWSPDGRLTIWCSSQGHFSIRDLTSGILGIPVGNIKVVPLEIGGGFGAKLFTTIEPVAALLSMKCGKPVKITLSRTEVFEAVGPTSAAHVHLKMGVTNEGRLTAGSARLVFEAGAFPGSPVIGAATCMFTPYDIPNARVEGFDVLVNKPKVTAYRAPGAPAGALAVETMIDEFCERLSMDPLEFRLLNAAKEGTRRVTGVAAPKLGFVETLEAARDTPHYQSLLTGPYRGRGVAAGFWGNAPGQASVTASILADGTISLVEGSPDIGGTRTTAAMQLAEALGLRAEDVHPSVADTDSVGFTSLTGGSSVAFKQGVAAYEVAQDLIKQLRERAARIWGANLDDVIYDAATLALKGDPQKRFTLKQIAARLNETGGPIVGRATVSPRGVGASHAVHIADVEVDPETGKVDVLRYTTVVDAGTAIHPSYVEGQMQGGAVQGIGWALNEEYVYDKDGRLLNSSFLDYRMPTALDVPPIETVIVEVPNPGHPFGVRGVGEIVIVPPLAALANAIAHATGQRMREVPMNPGRVLASLADASNGASPS